MERLTKRIDGYAHGAEGVSKDKLTGSYCRGEFEDTACVEKLAQYEDLEEQGLVVKLPCTIGTHLWRATKPYRKELKITEYVVKNFRTTGKQHRLQLEVQAINVPGTNWMSYSAFYTTREQAEQSLKEMEGENENRK